MILCVNIKATIKKPSALFLKLMALRFYAYVELLIIYTKINCTNIYIGNKIMRENLHM